MADFSATWVMRDGRPYNTAAAEIPSGGFPKSSFLWKITDKPFPILPFFRFGLTSMQKPFPAPLWRIEQGRNNGLPFHEYMQIPKPTGAFQNAKNLEAVYIPRTCLKIGEYSFQNTKLKRVKIPADCEFSPTSFPEGCEVEFYGGSGAYGQLIDSEGYEVLDSDGARIYVKE